MTALLPVPVEAPTLTARLAAWIDAEHITGFYPTAGIASRITASLSPEYLTSCLDGLRDTSFLRGACERIRDEGDLTDAEFAAESYWHGHGKRRFP